MEKDKLIDLLIQNGLSYSAAANTASLFEDLGPRDLLLTVADLFTVLAEQDFESKEALWYDIDNAVVAIVDEHLGEEDGD